MLTERGELNQTKLLSYCGLNLAKHRDILEELERKNLIEKNVDAWFSLLIKKVVIFLLSLMKTGQGRVTPSSRIFAIPRFN